MVVLAAMIPLLRWMSCMMLGSLCLVFLGPTALSLFSRVTKKKRMATQAIYVLPSAPVSRSIGVFDNVDISAQADVTLGSFGSHAWKSDVVIRERMARWDFGSETGIFDVIADYPGTILFATTIEGIAIMKLCDALGVDAEKLHLLVRTIESRYNNMPYHNSVHGADVVHATYWIIDHGGLGAMIQPLHKLALMISAAAHDIDHGGTSNTFERNTKSELALRYNGVSVLENMSISGLLQLLRRRSMNITESLAPFESAKFRELLVSTILATDLANHKQNVEAFGLYMDLPGGLSMENPAHCKCVLGITMHLSDIASVARKWGTYKQWIVMLFEEFHQLGDKEREHGLAVTTDRATSIPYKAQCGFINMFALNLFDKYRRFLPAMLPVKQQLNANLATLQSELERKAKTGGEGPLGEGESSSPKGFKAMDAVSSSIFNEFRQAVAPGGGSTGGPAAVQGRT
jgi:hypothetical protein